MFSVNEPAQKELLRTTALKGEQVDKIIGEAHIQKKNQLFNEGEAYRKPVLNKSV